MGSIKPTFKMSIEPTSVHSYVLQGTNIGDSDSCFNFLLLDNSIINQLWWPLNLEGTHRDSPGQKILRGYELPATPAIASARRRVAGAQVFLNRWTSTWVAWLYLVISWGLRLIWSTCQPWMESCSCQQNWITWSPCGSTNLSLFNPILQSKCFVHITQKTSMHQGLLECTVGFVSSFS